MRRYQAERGASFWSSSEPLAPHISGELPEARPCPQEEFNDRLQAVQLINYLFNIAHEEIE
jgi:hypothetical protein